MSTAKDNKLIGAVNNSNIAKARSLLKPGLFGMIKPADVSVKMSNGETPLILAARQGNLEIVKLLLENGAKANDISKEKITPLYVASENGHKEIAELLIAKGADVNAADKDGLTLLHKASSEGHKKIVELLISKGADKEAVNKDGLTPLYIMSGGGYKEMVALLINMGAGVDAASKNALTPLHGASNKGHKEIAELLISMGANMDAADKDGLTPLHKASSKGHKEIVELLISKGADIDAANKDGLTPLHKASSKGHKKIVELLISKGADVNKADKDGTTPLYIASQNEHEVIVELLIAKGASTEELSSQDKASLPNPTITQEYVSISLIESSKLGSAGPGGDSFQKAIQNMNNRDDAAAIRCFEEALIKGLDPLRQGYVHANLGEMYIRANAIEKALDEFKKVLNFKEALYESVHTAVQYLSILYRELGQPEVVNVLEQLKYKTSSKINTSLSPETVERVRQLTINNKSRLIKRESIASTRIDEGKSRKNISNDKEIDKLEAKAQYYIDRKKDGKFDQVIAELSPIIFKLPNKSELRKILSSTYLDRGAANYQQGNDDKALADFEEAAKVDHENWKALVNLASLYMASYRWTEALGAMEKAFEINHELNNNPGIVERLKQIRSHV